MFELELCVSINLLRDPDTLRHPKHQRTVGQNEGKNLELVQERKFSHV